MKPFEYYEEAPGVECYGYSWVNQQLKLYSEELAKIPLTVADRRERHAKRETELKAEVEKLNEPFLAAHAALKAEFWKDLREELGYDKLFNEAGVAYFEALVEEMKECRRHVPSLEETISSYYEDRYLQAKRLLVDYHSLRSQEIQKALEFVSYDGTKACIVPGTKPAWNDKQKVYLIARAILNGTATKGDEAILEETGLTTADLDKHYSLAETVIDKTMNKSETKPESISDCTIALQGWIDFYFQD